MRTEEFERLYAEHVDGLVGFLVYRTGDRVLAEDIVADTFEKVLRTKRRFDPRRASAKTWVYSIALNVLRDHLRRRDAETRALTRTGGPGEAPASREFDEIHERDELGRALAQLSEEEREALALRFGADMTVPEIAKLQGEKLTTIEGRVYRGLRKLKELLGDE